MLGRTTRNRLRSPAQAANALCREQTNTHAASAAFGEPAGAKGHAWRLLEVS
jgi:hypothetical protein